MRVDFDYSQKSGWVFEHLELVADLVSLYQVDECCMMVAGR